MEVTVWSLLANNSSGHITFRLPSSYFVRDLLHLYCLEKNITASKNYVLYSRNNVLLNPSKTLEESDVQNGDILMLTSLGKNYQLFAFGSWWVVAFLALVIGIAGIAYVLYLFFMPIGLPKKSAVIIDAGSSHSQLFVFTWTFEKPLEAGTVDLEHDCFMPGGVAELREDLDKLSDYFQPCLNEAKLRIPASQHASTPLVLAATAGMRLLRAYDPESAQQVLSTIRKVFWSNTKFMTEFKDVYIASGQQEGINGWTALNYLLKTFQEESDPPVSALDLGGASVQLTTEMSKKGNSWPTVNITIFNNTYRVFSKSFLCYGIGEALHRHEHFLLDSSSKGNKGVIYDPCLPKGISSSVTKMDFSDPCVHSNFTKDFPLDTSNTADHIRRFHVKYHEPDFNEHYLDYNNTMGSDETVIYTLQGSSDGAKCQKSVRSLFDFDLCNRTFLLGSCLNREIMPPYKGQLIGFSAIFLRLLPLLGVTQDKPLTEFKDAVYRTCYMNSSQLENLHPNISKEMLQDLCFDSMYVYTLLTEGLGITSERWKDLLFQDKVHKQDVAWTLGLMLNRTSSLPLQQPAAARIDLAPFILLLILFSSFLLTAGMAFYNTLRLKQQRHAYQRVNTEQKRQEHPSC